MHNQPVDVKRRHAFIAELRRLMDMDECEAETLQKAAAQGAHAFWEALRGVCAERTGEYILKIAENCADWVEGGLGELNGDPLALKHSDAIMSMIRLHMVSLCALELAKYENRELYAAVKACSGRTYTCLATVIPLDGGEEQPEKNRLN
ncbi:MAG: hypothetical protein IKU34_01215 [Clostridia bacterium]|nr:hypothetical protein [Clostridia bacterium]